jgi:hypothetical protein
MRQINDVFNVSPGVCAADGIKNARQKLDPSECSKSDFFEVGNTNPDPNAARRKKTRFHGTLWVAIGIEPSVDGTCPRVCVAMTIPPKSIRRATPMKYVSFNIDQ